MSKSDLLEEAKMVGLEEKVVMCKAKLINPFWVLHQMTNKMEAVQFCKMMGYSDGFQYVNKNRFKIFQ